MAFEIRENSGSLFKNDKKEKDTHPNAKGKAMIDGRLYYVSAWSKKDRNGSQWQSLSFTPADKEQPQGNAPRSKAPVVDTDSDDIPF